MKEEKELVEKLKEELKKWVEDMNKDEQLIGDKEIEQLNNSKTFQDLTKFVKQVNWDVESWIIFCFKDGLNIEIDIDDLKGFDT